MSIEYKDGDRVKVSRHYAGYKHQYEFLYGTIYFNAEQKAMVRIEIPVTDIEQDSGIELACWGKIEKV